MRIIPSIPFCEKIPDHFTLGETNAEIELKNVEENRNMALLLASQARHSINIFSQDMDDRIYNNEEFEKYVINLAARHRSAQIRILVHDSMLSVKKGHCLIRVAQKLTSSVLIKNPGQTHKKDKSSFITVDGLGMLYRAHADNYNYQASANFMSPQRVTKLEVFFNEAWEHGLPDPQVRRLFV